MIYPESYSQLPGNDVLPDGTYDFSKLSAADLHTIIEVLRVSKSDKYPHELHGLGIVNEAEQVRYKPRYVLHDIIIKAYRESTNAIDLLAVGFAFKTKGAAFRKQAIDYFERYQHLANRSQQRLAADCFSGAQEPFFSYGLAELYDSEYRFDLALEYATYAEKHNASNAPAYPQLIASILLKTNPADCVEYLKYVTENPKYQNYRKLFSDELEKAQSKMERGYKYRPRPYRPKSREIELEKQISALAAEFLPDGKYYNLI